MCGSSWRWTVAVAGLQLCVTAGSFAYDYVGRYTFDGSGLGAQTLAIRSDGTFEYTSSGCLSGGRTSGTWKEVAPNVIETTSYDRAEPPRVESWRDAGEAGLVVTVLDSSGSALPGATVVVSCDDAKAVDASADVRGRVEIPFCTVVAMSIWLDGFESLNVEEPAVGHNHFEVVLPEPRLILEGERWLMLDGRLYKLGVAFDRQEAGYD